MGVTTACQSILTLLGYNFTKQNKHPFITSTLLLQSPHPSVHPSVCPSAAPSVCLFYYRGPLCCPLCGYTGNRFLMYLSELVKFWAAPKSLVHTNPGASIQIITNLTSLPFSPSPPSSLIHPTSFPPIVKILSCIQLYKSTASKRTMMINGRIFKNLSKPFLRHFN